MLNVPNYIELFEEVSVFIALFICWNIFQQFVYFVRMCSYLLFSTECL